LELEVDTILFEDNWIEVPSVNYSTYILKAYTNDYGRYLKSWFVFGRIYMYSQKEKNKTIMILTITCTFI
jgi:hypothetical protein